MMQPESNAPNTNPAQMASKNRLEQTQQQVDDVVGIMKENVNRMVEREDRLNDLDKRATYLSTSASEFQTTSRKLKKKYWWKNIKMMIILGVVVAVIIAIIIIIVYSESSGGGGGGGDSGGGGGDQNNTKSITG